MKLKKLSTLILSVLLVVALCAQTAFAADITANRDKTARWLQNAENTEFDYTETAYPDSLIDWTVFALARDFRDVPAEYKAYIHEAVKNSFEMLYPSDLARIILSTTACGLDAKNIGGHNLLAALGAVDYTSQIYLSSLAFPLLAMDFKADFAFSAEKRTEIVETILACQQPDGGWSYCSEDLYGYGIFSEPDSTAMALQALAPYQENAAVSEAAERAFVYLQSQQSETGAMLSFGAPSGESTAQTVLALCAWGENPESARFTVGDKTLLDGLCDFITENGGALNYANVEDPLTTYQVLLGLTAADRFNANRNTVFNYDEKPADTPNEETTEAPANGEQPEVEIPKTGGKPQSACAPAVLCAMATAVLVIRKHDAV